MTVTAATKAPRSAAKAPVKRAAKAPVKAPVTPAVEAPVEAPVVEAPVELTLEELVMEVKQNWMLANDAETAGKKGVQAAKLALDTTRVLKTRVAFHAAQLGSRATNNAPGLNGATRVLYCTADMTPGAQKIEIDKKKASVKLYWLAAQALDAAGLAHETGEPTDEERKIVLEAFRAGKKKTPRVDDGGKASTGGESEESEGGTPAKDETPEITADSFLPFIAGLNATLTAVKAKKVPVSEEQAAEMIAFVKAFSDQLTAYVNG